MRPRSWFLFCLNLVFCLGLQLGIAQLQLWGFALTPFPYILCLILLPMNLAPILSLLFGFAVGFAFDIIYHTFGLHASASVLMMYVRVWILNGITAKSVQESQVFPRVVHMGWGWYLIYTSVLVALHHLCIFILEAGTWLYFFRGLGHLLLSALGTYGIFGVLELGRTFFGSKR